MNMHYSICHIHSPQLTFELHSRTINFLFCFCCFHSLLACSKNYMLDCIGDRVKIYIFLIDNLNTLLNMMIMMMIVHCATARWCSHLFLFLFHRQSFLANELDALEGVCEERIMVSQEKCTEFSRNNTLNWVVLWLPLPFSTLARDMKCRMKRRKMFRTTNWLFNALRSWTQRQNIQSSETKTNLNRCC